MFTELVYAPDELSPEYPSRLLKSVVAPGGWLLVAECRSREMTAPSLTIDETFRAFGFAVEMVATAVDAGVEQSRVAVIRND